MSMPIDRYLDALIRDVKALKMSKRAIAREANIHSNTLQRFGHPDWTPAIHTIRRLEEMLSRHDSDSARPNP